MSEHILGWRCAEAHIRVYGEGVRFECTCGEVGPVQVRDSEAKADRDAHFRANTPARVA